jgi:hypothetical protein
MLPPGNDKTAKSTCAQTFWIAAAIRAPPKSINCFIAVSPHYRALSESVVRYITTVRRAVGVTSVARFWTPPSCLGPLGDEKRKLEHH